MVMLTGFFLRNSVGDAIVGWLLFIGPMSVFIARTFTVLSLGMLFLVVGPYVRLSLTLSRTLIHRNRQLIASILREHYH